MPVAGAAPPPILRAVPAAKRPFCCTFVEAPLVPPPSVPGDQNRWKNQAVLARSHKIPSRVTSIIAPRAERALIDGSPNVLTML